MCVCTCLCNCRKVMTTCLFYKLWVCLKCFLPFVASVLGSDSRFSVFGKNKASPDTSCCSQKTSYVKSRWISISVKCLQWSSGNEKVRVMSFCLAYTCCTCCLAVADQSEPKLSKMSCKTDNLNQLLCTFYTAPCHLWSLWDCTHSHGYSKQLTLGR